MAGITVRGLRELQIVAAASSKEMKRDVTAELRGVAEEIRSDAEGLALSSIPRIGPKWYRMRTGVTRKAVYVAPKQRGVKGRGSGGKRRPKFADLMEQRVMDPAQARNEANVEARVEHALENIALRWNRI